MGAFVFEILESENELMVKRNMTKNRLSVTDDLWAITKNMKVLKKDEWTGNVTDNLKNFEKRLIKALKQEGWDGSESEKTVTWSFSGGLFYSITVITTIGYGHIAPKTSVAKIVTIFYAILGIPLTVLCWSNIGDAMANSFRFCYWRICCYVCTKKPKKRKRKAASRSRGMSVRHSSSRGRSVRRSQRTSRSADTISDSLNSYSISDPDRFFDDGGTAVDIQSFHTQPGSDGVPVSVASGTRRSIFQRNRPSKKSLEGKSSNQAPTQQVSNTTTPGLVPNNQIMLPLSTALTQQQMALSQNGHNHPINNQNAQAIPIVTATSTNQGSVQQSISTYGINVSSEPSKNLLENPMLAVVSNSHDIIPPQTLSAITHVPSTTSSNRHERDSVPTSTSISTK